MFAALVHSGEIFPLPVIQSVPPPAAGSWVCQLSGGLMAVVDLAGLTPAQGLSQKLCEPRETNSVRSMPLGLNAALPVGMTGWAYPARVLCRLSPVLPVPCLCCPSS